jgi:MFS family permease
MPRSTRLTLFAGGVFAVESGFFAVIPPLVPGLARDLHLTTAEVGLLVSAYPAGVVLGAIPSIALVERFGVRTTAFTGLGLLAVATIGFALGTSGLTLDGARFVQGFGGAVAWGGALAWLTGTASEARRGAVIGGAIGAALLGTVFGPAVGALAAEFGRGPAFGALAVLLALLALAAPASAPVPVRMQGSVRALFRLLRHRQAVAGNVALFVIGFVGGTTWSLTPLLVVRLGGNAVTIAAMVASGYVLAAGLNVFIGPLTDRVGRLRPTVSMLVFAALLLPWLPAYGALAPLIVTSVLASSTLSGLWTPTAAMVSDGGAPTPGGQAVAVAAMNAAWAGGGAVGPVIMASIADNFGFQPPFIILGALCAASAVFALATYRRQPVRQPVADRP